MRFTRLRLENWRNFIHVDAPLSRRVFLVGPNACGKSNLLDALKFLRDVAADKRGFQWAVTDGREGVSQIRSLHARRYPEVVVAVEVELDDGLLWSYELAFGQDNQRKPVVKREKVVRDGRTLLERPDAGDRADPGRMTQTHLEQVFANKEIRLLQEGLSKVKYLHLVPQLVRDADRKVGRIEDPHGEDFLEQVARTPVKTQRARLARIAEALKVAVPTLEKLDMADDHGVPHLKGLYRHWRPNAGWQSESQFSDGTLRLLGLLWSLLDGRAPLLLEEPELSLNAAVVRRLPSVFARMGRASGRQILLSTHSPEMLGDEGISLEEILLLVPGTEGTRVEQPALDSQIRALLDGGVPMAEAILPRTAPKESRQLALWGK